MAESDKTADQEGVSSEEPQREKNADWAAVSTVALDLGKRFGQLIGRYKVVRVLGEGGMGSVFLAEQDKPTRLVAMKVIRPGVVSANLLRRFEHEAQVLGRLQHPGIAQIYEAGTADTGEGAQPYFVMEYVRGRSLVEYAQASQLGTRQRLELLAKICDAVQHAHQKGIIHRDLKPGNILVTEEGQPKILDFGVARATDADIQVTTIQTDVGQLVGTIPYMSPEQAGGDATELDTRSDVYALGVLGYELLAGRLPYDLSKKMIHEAVRVIREDDPTPLSSIDRVFRGDVETIIAKALQKERTRRYQSASDLGSDIRRYLSDQPIVARPPSVGYQLSKFVRRNRTGVIAGTVVASALVVATVISIGFALSEAEQRGIAEAEAKRAATEKAITEALDDFLNKELLATGRREVLDAAAERIEEAYTPGGRFEDKPLIEASIRLALANAYWGLGEYEAAEPYAEQAFEILRMELGQEHPDTLDAMNSLAVMYKYQGRYDEAEALYREALTTLRRVLDDEDPLTLSSMNNLAVLLRTRDKLDEAEALHREALRTRRRILGDQHPETLSSMTNLAVVWMALNQLEDAELLVREALEIRQRVLGEDHPRTLQSMYVLATIVLRQDKPSDAEVLYRRTLKNARRVFSSDHPYTLLSLYGLALSLFQQEKLAEAEPLALECYETNMGLYGSVHTETVKAINLLIDLYDAWGKPHETAKWRAQLPSADTLIKDPGDNH